MATPLPQLNTSPLPNKPAEVTPSDQRKLWEAVQKLQADLNQLIMYIQENP